MEKSTKSGKNNLKQYQSKPTPISQEVVNPAPQIKRRTLWQRILQIWGAKK